MSALNSNKYEELMQGDESYGALMFFSFLQERNFEEKLSSTVGEISDLRKALQGGANGGHISFNDMKKRVENLVKVSPRASAASEAASIVIDRAVAREGGAASIKPSAAESQAQRKAKRSGKGGGGGSHLKKIKNLS